MKRHTYYEHALSRMPNYPPFHWLVTFINWRLAANGSKWKLDKRYRKPRKGKQYGWSGQLRRLDAKAFSIYIHERQGYRKMQDARRHELNTSVHRTIEAQRQQIREMSGERAQLVREHQAAMARAWADGARTQKQMMTQGVN